jgi:hypothetical protein
MCGSDMNVDVVVDVNFFFLVQPRVKVLFILNGDNEVPLCLIKIFFPQFDGLNA